MSKDRQRLADYLMHMLQAIERITRYTELLDEMAFLQNELVQDAVIRKVDYEVVWRTIHAELPSLYVQVQHAISSLV
jgi:uncharacterized protein with HEPN domain